MLFRSITSFCLANLVFVSLLEAQSLWRKIESSSQGVLPAPSVEVEPTTSLTLDVDHDGDEDFIIASRVSGPAITLWRRGENAWTTEVIEEDYLSIEAGGAVFDIDNDGDLDILAGGDSKSGAIWWWENPHPNRGSWKRRLVKNNDDRKHHDQIFGDFDGDGKIELVAWNQAYADNLLLFEIPENPLSNELWPSKVIYHWTKNEKDHEGLAKADINGDGVEDIIGAGLWFNYLGKGTFEPMEIDPKMRFTRAGAGQLIEGGVPEVVFGPGDADGPLKIYEKTKDGWNSTTLEPMILHGHSLRIADVDQDGHLDIFVAEMGQWKRHINNPLSRTMIFYGNGNGSFKRQIVNIGQGQHESRLADLDGDGDLDILGKPFRHNTPKLVVWLNQGKAPRKMATHRWERHLIDGPIGGKRLFVEVADMDGDGLPDIVAGASWHKNPGTIGGDWERRTIGEPFLNLAISHDFDSDGDLDLLGTTSDFKGSQFALAINDGTGKFKIRSDLPAGSGDFLQGVAAGNLQDQKNMVVLSWHKHADRLEGLVFPDDAATGEWELIELSPHTLMEQVSLGDIDGDADADLLLGTAWMENTGDSWTPHTIGKVKDLDPESESDRNKLADINGDGRLDAVVVLEKGIHALWFEQPASSPMDPWTRHVIGQVPGQGFSMDTVDLDFDGDFDVIVGEHRNPSGENQVLLFENRDGRGGSWEKRVIDSGKGGGIDHHDGTIASDLDGDGDLDIVSIGYYHSKVWVYENKAVDPR